MASDERPPLLRLLPPRVLARKKVRPNFPGPPQRKASQHAAALRRGVGQARQHLEQAERIAPLLATEVPYVRLQFAPGMVVTDAEVRGLGLVPVFRREDSVLAAYATDRDLKPFARKLGAYAREDAKHLILAKLDSIGPWSRVDRTSPRLAEVTIEPDGVYVVDLLLLPIDGASANPNALIAIDGFVRQRQGQILDRMQAPSLSALRVRLGGQGLDDLLEYRDDVALVDLPPKASLLVPQVLGLDLDDVPDVGSPATGAPTVCVVDSGILEGHPLLEKAVLGDRSKSYPATLGSPIPGPEGLARHGTQVAGIALYGDVAACVGQKKFAPAAWLINARLLDDNAELDPGRMPFVRGIVDDVKDRCRLFNLSLGLTAAQAGLSAYAADMDALARDEDILFIVSAGNQHPGDLYPDGRMNPGYPEYLLTDAWRVLTPGEALNALTVGGIATDRDPHPLARGLVAIAPARAPSPFSRSGGVKNVVKPELVELAGNLAFDSTTRRWVDNNPGLGVPTTGPRFATGQLLTFAHGTSISAPKVANLAARVLDRYPEASANLVRALLVHSASLPEGARDYPTAQAMRLCGFGVPDLDRAIYCAPGRATLFHQGAINVDDVVLFEIPVPSAIASSKGRKRIIVTMAYDPPVSALDRVRPAGIVLTWGLARGDVPEEKVTTKIAAEAAEAMADTQQAVQNIDKSSAGAKKKKKEKSVFMPGELPRRIQQRGTVQKNIYDWKRGDYGDPYRLAITAKASRPAFAGAEQRFALVVTVESEDGSVNVYQSVRARIAAGRVRVRVQE